MVANPLKPSPGSVGRNIDAKQAVARLGYPAERLAYIFAPRNCFAKGGMPDRNYSPGSRLASITTYVYTIQAGSLVFPGRKIRAFRFPQRRRKCLRCCSLSPQFPRDCLYAPGSRSPIPLNLSYRQFLLCYRKICLPFSNVES